MKSAAPEYRSYQITREGGFYFAVPSDGDEIVLRSAYVHRVRLAITQLWEAVETNKIPSWFENALESNNPCIDLDTYMVFPELTVAPAVAPFDFAQTVKEKVAGFMNEAAPSEVDPPSFARQTFLALLITLAIAPIAFLIQQFGSRAEPEIVFTMAVVAVAVTQGQRAALLLSAFSMVSYNLNIIPPVWTITAPGESEIIYTLANAMISIAVPWLLSFRFRAQEAKEALTTVAAPVNEPELA